MSLTLPSKQQTDRNCGFWCCSPYATKTVDRVVIMSTSLTTVLTIWAAQRAPFCSFISHGISARSTTAGRWSVQNTNQHYNDSLTLDVHSLLYVTYSIHFIIRTTILPSLTHSYSHWKKKTLVRGCSHCYYGIPFALASSSGYKQTKS